MSQIDYRSRIVGHGEESPEQLLANPANFRIHPKAQQDALAGVLEQVGYVQSVIVNQTTGHLIDGHLRVTLALRQEQATVPVVYVELSPEEEALVLATFDPISALAVTDTEKLTELLQDVSVSNPAIESMLNELAGNAPDAGDTPGSLYTAEVNVPHYEIVGERPDLSELCDTTRADNLTQKINASRVTEAEKSFLLAAANRHLRFDYRKVAEYYPHATPEMQRLMEESALIIIDMDDAIRLGYAKFANAIDQLQKEDREDAE